MTKERNIFDRLQAGEWILPGDPGYKEVGEIVSRTMKLLAELNASGDVNQARSLLAKLQVHQSTKAPGYFHRSA